MRRLNGKIKWNPSGVIAVIIFTVYCCALFFDVPCLYRKVFGIHCPGCGIRSAFASFLRGDIKGAWESNAMFFSLPLVGLLILKNGRVFHEEAMNRITLILLGTAWIIAWILSF